VKGSVKAQLARIHREATRRPDRTVVVAMGQKRYFRAYDLGDDTFIFQRGVWLGLEEHASVLIVDKADLRAGARGHVMTVTTGNHSVAALPLLGGKFWDLLRLKPAKRGDVMAHAVLCGNVVEGKLELSQRDVPCRKLVAYDDWLVSKMGFPMQDVVMVERDDATLEHYRRLGQEWRVKPLAWTETEMRVALAASRKRISCDTRYYHASRGVHFLSYSDFHALGDLAETDWNAFRAALRELVGVFEGHTENFLRQPKYHGHHEIELFGIPRGVALERLVPELESLMEGIVLRRTGPADAAARFREIDALYKSLLTRPELGDDASRAFTETLYIYLTGEIYSVMGEGSTPAFDDRRTALPGASFVDGRPVFHPGADARSEVLLSNLRALVSKDEFVEYANVYELRTTDAADAETAIGRGSTREIVYKTNRRPLVASLVEKRLSRAGRDYGSYVLARVEAFKSLGVALADYRLLRRRAGEKRRSGCDYYIRTRCEGEPLSDIPSHYFQLAGEFGGADAGEDPKVVSALAFLMGDAAAQNLAMKKYDAATKTPLYGVGKEIYRFGWSTKEVRAMPEGVSCCAVRGALGWPDCAYTEENLRAIARFYLKAYAETLKGYAAAHTCVPEGELAERFFAGFEFRLRALEWCLAVHRDGFEDFDPRLPHQYGFLRKWRFALWALERHVRRIGALRAIFLSNFNRVNDVVDDNAAQLADALDALASLNLPAPEFVLEP